MVLSEETLLIWKKFIYKIDFEQLFSYHFIKQLYEQITNGEKKGFQFKPKTSNGFKEVVFDYKTIADTTYIIYQVVNIDTSLILVFQSDNSINAANFWKMFAEHKKFLINSLINFCLTSESVSFQRLPDLINKWWKLLVEQRPFYLDLNYKCQAKNHDLEFWINYNHCTFSLFLDNVKSSHYKLINSHLIAQAKQIYINKQNKS